MLELKNVQKFVNLKIPIKLHYTKFKLHLWNQLVNSISNFLPEKQRNLAHRNSSFRVATDALDKLQAILNHCRTISSDICMPVSKLQTLNSTVLFQAVLETFSCNISADAFGILCIIHDFCFASSWYV